MTTKYPLQLKNEPSKYPRREYVTGRWRVQLDRHPKQYSRWDWMIEEQNNGPVYWHRTIGDEPSYEDVKRYIKSQHWSGDDYRG